MTRTLFFFTCLAAMLATVTAVLIRVELAYPGISPLFSLPDGVPDGTKFTNATIAHMLFAYLTVMLLGTTMCAAASDQSAPVAAAFKWLGTLLCVLVGLATILAAIPVGEAAVAGTGVGWVLYPPLSTNVPNSALDLVLQHTPARNLLDVNLSRVLLLPAAALLYIGAFQMLSTLQGYRWVGAAGALLVILLTLLAATNTLILSAPRDTSLYLLAALPLIAFGAIRLIDDAAPWVVMLTLGCMVTVIAQLSAILAPATQYLGDTMGSAALLYVFPLGLTWFALPALILFTRPSRMSPLMVWLAPGFIAGYLILWLDPLLRLGIQGMPANYVDYPDAFADQNLTATLAVGLFVLVYLGTVTLIRRSTR